VESYGRDAVENPDFAPQVDATLDEGTRRLKADGFGARSGFLTSPITGGGSYLAHDTLLSGLWVDNAQRSETLLASDRTTVNSAFHRAGWRVTGIMPAVDRDWPEGKFFAYDKFYDSRNIGYQGPKFSYVPVPDQFTLAAFQRLERGPGHQPVMAEIPLVSSHAPWTPIPTMVGGAHSPTFGACSPPSKPTSGPAPTNWSSVRRRPSRPGPGPAGPPSRPPCGPSASDSIPVLAAPGGGERVSSAARTRCHTPHLRCGP
jgi:hypothetical protein